MNKWHLGIPKILHVYWGANKLPYLRYLTIASFRHYNPDWKIVYYKPSFLQPVITWATSEQKYSDNYVDYAHYLSELDVEVVTVNFGDYKFPNTASEVHKSDFLRWMLLYEQGGLWADMDILFTKPMNSLCFNNPTNANVNAVFCISGYGHSIGFLMGSIGNDYFRTISDSARKEYNKTKYQCLGSLLCNKLFPTVDSARKDNIVPLNLPMDVVYAYDANHVKEIYAPQSPNKLTDNSVGIHWYAGHPLSGDYLNKTDGGFNAKGDCILTTLIKDFNTKKPKDSFNAIYKSNFWGSAESVSGKGSEYLSTVTIRENLPSVFSKHNIKRVLDVGCGDFNWIRGMAGSFDYYLGTDVVGDIIANNKKKHTTPRKVEFLCADIKTLDISKYNFDVVVLADVLVHLSFDDIQQVLANIRSSNVRFILMTHFSDHAPNENIDTGDWRCLNMSIEPFNLPSPIESLPYNEPYNIGKGEKNDKTLSLWQLK